MVSTYVRKIKTRGKDKYQPQDRGPLGEKREWGRKYSLNCICNALYIFIFKRALKQNWHNISSITFGGWINENLLYHFVYI